MYRPEMYNTENVLFPISFLAPSYVGCYEQMYCKLARMIPLRGSERREWISIY